MALCLILDPLLEVVQAGFHASGESSQSACSRDASRTVSAEDARVPSVKIPTQAHGSVLRQSRNNQQKGILLNWCNGLLASLVA